MTGVELMIVLIVLSVVCLFLYQQYDTCEKDLAARRLAFEKKRAKVERDIELREQSCSRLEASIEELKQKVAELEVEMRRSGVAPPIYGSHGEG